MYMYMYMCIYIYVICLPRQKYVHYIIPLRKRGYCQTMNKQMYQEFKCARCDINCSTNKLHDMISNVAPTNYMMFRFI